MSFPRLNIIPIHVNECDNTALYQLPKSLLQKAAKVLSVLVLGHTYPKAAHQFLASP